MEFTAYRQFECIADGFVPVQRWLKSILQVEVCCYRRITKCPNACSIARVSDICRSYRILWIGFSNILAPRCVYFQHLFDTENYLFCIWKCQGEIKTFEHQRSTELDKLRGIWLENLILVEAMWIIEWLKASGVGFLWN